MTPIFPPLGAYAPERFDALKDEEREYLLFCLEFCAAVLEARPFHPEALEVAANHFTELGYFTDGLRLDERLAGLRPDDPGVLYNLSCSLALTGAEDAALAALARAVANGYHNHQHMVADRDLSSLRADPRFSQLVSEAEKAGKGGARRGTAAAE